MASFGETARKIKQETLVSVLRVLGLTLFFLVLGISFIFWQQRQAKLEPPETPTRQELTDQQKKAILDSLAAPQDAPQYTDEEKKQILRSLLAPSNDPALSDEEKKKILESLSAPQ